MDNAGAEFFRSRALVDGGEGQEVAVVAMEVFKEREKRAERAGRFRTKDLRGGGGEERVGQG